MAGDPAARIVVLTTCETDADTLRAVAAGAAGYLLKDSPRPEVANAIRRRRAVRPCWPRPAAARLVTRAPASGHGKRYIPTGLLEYEFRNLDH